MISSAVTNKYAKALFDVTYQAGKSGEVASQLLEIAKAFNNHETIAFFNNPFGGINEKLAIVNSTLEGRCAPEVLNFLNVLVHKNRMGLIDEISQEYLRIVQTSAGITKGKIYSPINLAEDFIKKVEAVASKSLGQKIELNFEKDESLIAGYKVQVGGWTLDDSADAHLKLLKDELMKRGL